MLFLPKELYYWLQKYAVETNDKIYEIMKKAVYEFAIKNGYQHEVHSFKIFNVLNDKGNWIKKRKCQICGEIEDE